MSNPQPAPEQLELLAVDDIPLQFRLDRRTREIGLAHIARIRAERAERHRQQGRDNAA